MLHNIQFAVQHVNPYIIKALTDVHGVYVNVYDKLEMTEYDEGRDSYISNSFSFNDEPTYSKIKLLLNVPVQETYDSGEDSFYTYMQDIYFLTCDKKFVFNKEQKFEVFYDKKDSKPQRVFQSFEVKEISNSYNQWSVRKIMLKTFN